MNDIEIDVSPDEISAIGRYVFKIDIGKTTQEMAERIINKWKLKFKSAKMNLKDSDFWI